MRWTVPLLTLLAGCGGDVPEAPGAIGVTASDRPYAAPKDEPTPQLNEGPRPWRFVEVSRAVGIDYSTHYSATDATAKTQLASQVLVLVTGVAAGDFDGDGWPDLYVSHGDVGSDLLFKNRGDGTFVDVAASAGVATSGARTASPLFADVDGDGRLDLFIGGIEDTSARLLRNVDGASFVDITADSGLGGERVVVDGSFGDYDLDGDLDLAVGRWGAGDGHEHLFRGDGRGHFVAAGKAAGLGGFGPQNMFPGDFSFTPNFVDIDDDGRPDLLWSSDYTTSQYFLNKSTPGMDAFQVMRPAFLVDRNGMGSAIGDYDNDGRLDWFVTSIFNPTVQYPPQVGNRLYRNIGGGLFEDTTEKAGVKDGGWAWGTCFADFNNDGYLDLFQVNGFRGRPGSDESLYTMDRSRFFLSNGDGTFSERSHALGIDDTAEGRGLICFDYDGDGDIDLFIANSEGPPELFRNQLGESQWLDVKLQGRGKNTEGIGARIFVTAGGTTQVRELRAGSNYASQDPAIAHYGLGRATGVEKVRVLWPDRSESTVENVTANQRLVIAHP